MVNQLHICILPTCHHFWHSQYPVAVLSLWIPFNNNVFRNRKFPFFQFQVSNKLSANSDGLFQNQNPEISIQNFSFVTPQNSPSKFSRYKVLARSFKKSLQFSLPNALTFSFALGYGFVQALDYDMNLSPAASSWHSQAPRPLFPAEGRIFATRSMKASIALKNTAHS